jgi:CRP-like cAMP-binding protein
VAKGGRVLGELAAGDLVGSALLLSGVPSDVDAVAMEPVRAMSWQVETLQRYLAANPETRTIMLRHLASDLATKVMRLGQGSASN